MTSFPELDAIYALVIKDLIDNHEVDDEGHRLDALLAQYVEDYLDEETVKNHPEIQFLQASENAYDSGYNYAMSVMQPLFEYLRSDQFVEDFEPATDDYDDVNGLFSNWLDECIDGSKEYSPWEHIASKINSFPDPDATSDLWAIYDDGQQAAVEYWVSTQGLRNETELMAILDEHEDKTLVVEYRLSNNCWNDLDILEVFEHRGISVPDFIPNEYLEGSDMSYLQDLAHHGCDGGLFIIYNTEIWDVAHKSKDLDTFLFDNDWQPRGEDLTDTVVKAVWFAAQTWAMNVLSELELDY